MKIPEKPPEIAMSPADLAGGIAQNPRGSSLDIGVIDTTSRVAKLITRRGIGLGIIIALTGLGIWVSPLISAIVLPYLQSLSLGAQVVFVGIWVAVFAVLGGALVRIIGGFFTQ